MSSMTMEMMVQVETHGCRLDYNDDTDDDDNDNNNDDDGDPG